MLTQEPGVAVYFLELVVPYMSVAGQGAEAVRLARSRINTGPQQQGLRGVAVVGGPQVVRADSAFTAELVEVLGMLA